MNTIRSIAVIVIAGALAGSVHAQNIGAAVGGIRVAADYAYGWPGITATSLNIAPNGGNSGTGTATIILNTGTVGTSNQGPFNPIAVGTPIYVGFASNQDLVTPTAVSGCGQGQPLGTCTITGTGFNNLHGPNEPVFSGTYGLQEAINAAHNGGGGRVALNATWTGIGGSTATITSTSITPYANVFVEDNRSSPLAPYWGMQPTTLTVLAVPTTLTATNIVFTSATGTWAASSTHFTATCVDPLGGESAASADYTQTPTVNYTLTVPVPPTCSTGAVGWRLYAGTSSAATSYLLPVTSSNCTLSTLVNTIAACALTSTGTWAATFTTTTNLAPVALGVTNTSNPVPEGHTTFGYQPSVTTPVQFQTNYGPCGSGSIASATASDLTPLCSFNLPAGFQNTIGRTIRVTGKISLTAGASSTLGITIGTVWPGGVTAGAPVTVCNPISGFVWATHAYTSVNFSCTMTTNAVGATAIGSIMPESMFMGGYAAGTLIPVGTDNTAATIGSLGLFAQNEYTVFLAPLVAADTTVQLQSMHIEVLQ